MSISVDRELTLGVLFKGRVDATFTAAVNELRTAMKGVAGATTSSTSATATASKETRKFADENALVGKRIGQVVGGFQRLTAAMKVTASYGLAATVIFGFINTLRKGSAAIIDFDQVLKNLQAVTGGTNAEVGALGREILKVAADTRYSAKEVGEAAVLLGQAGFNASESLAAIGAVSDLATGTLANMADVADLVTTVIRSYKLEASDAREVTDIFANSVNKSKATIDKLRTAFNYIGPIANQVGLSLKSTTAILDYLYDSGLKGSTAATGLRQVLSRLVNPSEKVKTIFKSMGADLTKLNPSLTDMRDVLEELEKVLGKNVEKSERARRAFAIFGQIGATAASAIAQGGVEAFDKYLKQLDAVGSSQDMAAIQMQGLRAMADNLGDRLYSLAVALGEGGIAGAFRTLLTILAPLVDLLTLLANTIGGKLIVMFTSMTTALLLSRIALKYVLVELSALSFGYTIATVKAMIAVQYQNTLNVAWTAGAVAIRRLWVAMLAHPYVAIFAGIAAVVSGLIMWQRHTEQVKQKTEEHAIAVQSQVVSLGKYKDRIDENTKAGKSSSDIVERLIREYPELTKYVNLATMAFMDEGKALEKLIELKRDKYLADLIKVAVAEEKSAERSKLRAKRISDEGLMTPEGFLAQKDVYDLEAKALREASVSLELYGMKAEVIAQGLKDKNIPITASYAEVYAALGKIVTGVSVPALESLTKAIMAVWEAQAKKPKPDLEEYGRIQKDVLGAMGEAGRKYYETLNNLQKAHFLIAAEKLTKEKEAMRKSAGEALVKDEATINALEDELGREALMAFKDKEDAKVYAKKDTFDKLREMAYELGGQAEELETEKIIDAWEKRDREYRKQLNQNILTYKEYNRAILENAKNRDEALDQNRKKYELKKVPFDKDSIEGVYSEATQSIEVMKWQTEEEAKIRSERAKQLTEEYNLGKISTEDYLQFLREAWAEAGGDIYNREYLDKVAASTGSWFDQLQYGMERAKATGQSFGQMWIDIGRRIEDTIATNMTGGLLDFVEGTKTATEAMQDFGRSTLRWLAEIIIKQQILNGLRGMSTGTWMAGMFGAVGHTGGIIGETKFPERIVDPNIFAGAKRYHGGGIVGEEYPIIAKRKEGIFTPEQMKALGGGQNIRIEMINKSDTPLKASSGQPRFDMGQMILNVVLEGAARNKGGFKDQMRGALSG